MQFNRPPRLQKFIEPIEIKVPFPSPLPQEPKINWLTLILPIFITGAIIGGMALLISSSSSTSYLMFLPLMLVGVIVSVVSYFQQKKEYKSIVEERLNKYREFLIEKEENLRAAKDEQSSILLEQNPSPNDCAVLSTKQPLDTRLGERRPTDVDFLKIRIGLGTQPSEIKIDTPEETNRDTELSELYDAVELIRKEYVFLENTPILTSIPEIGCLGIVGEPSQVHSFARSIAISLTTHHWVSEVQLAVFCTQQQSNYWDWMQLLPHKPKHSSQIVNEVQPGELKNPRILALEHEIRRRETYRDNTSSNNSSSERFNTDNLPALVVFIDNISNVYDFAAFSLILERSRNIGIYGIFLNETFTDIPGECGAVVEFTNDFVEYKETGTTKIPIKNIVPDEVSIQVSENFAKSLSAIEWIVPEKITEPPDDLSLMDLFDSKIDDLPIEKWWDEESPWGFLKAPIGKFSPTADLIFDLSEDGNGPHGIIGGTTGSGKSETLRTLILSMALTHNPYDLNFALIDFKGGAAFRGLEKLPHVVGLITDIENNVDYASRVIQSLSGEIKTRKQVLNKALEKVSLFRAHVDDYRTIPVRRPLPHLVIIFDEFAEFKEQYPSESHQLVSIARVGRSLGIHLILCAQSPSAVVEDQIRQNSKFRICLPVSSAEDSRGFIGIPDACDLPIGQAYFLVKKPQKFRVAYTGDYQLESFLPENAIVRTNPDGKREVIFPEKYRQKLPKAKTEAMLLIEKIISVTESLAINELPKVWQTPMMENLYLSDLLMTSKVPLSWNNDTSEFFPVQKHDIGFIFGLMDDPINQLQPVISFGAKGSSKNMLIFGPSGSGKSTLLRTLITSIALERTPSEANIYCLDFGGQHSLKIFQDESEQKHLDLPHLPQIGGVIIFGEKERVYRLFAILDSIILKRELKFKHKASSLDEYNSKVDVNEKLPDIFIFIDGLTKQITDSVDGFTDKLDDILKKGGSAGIHVVITANNVGDVPEKIKIDINGIGEIIILKPVDTAQIQSTFGNPAPDSFVKKAQASQHPKSGQGVLNKNPVLEIQIALPIKANEDKQIDKLRELIDLMHLAWEGSRPTDIEVLPFFVMDKELITPKYWDSSRSIRYEDTLGILLGVEQRSLKSSGLSIEEDGPIFQILSETSKLGKTTVLKTWILNLAEKFSSKEIQFLIIDFHKHTLTQFSEIPHIFKYVNEQSELKDALLLLDKKIKERRNYIQKGWKKDKKFDQLAAVRQLGFLVIVIDDFIEMCKYLSEEALEHLYKCLDDGKDFGIRLILTEDVAHFTTANDILKMSSKYGCGILLGGNDGFDYYNETKNPYQKQPILPGRGYLIREKKAAFFQAATYFKQEDDPIFTLEERLKNL